MEDPIDFVVLWVDGGDPKWRALKKKYQHEAISTEGDGGDGDERYRDWGLFRYWFRAVEKYAPWVNHIYLVTCGQVPEWLDLHNPKITLVTHDEFIDARYLPTFSSSVIETNIHRIQGLSEHFVYFNDDVFLNAPVAPEYFFQAGRMAACPVARPLVPSPANDMWSHMMFSVFGMMNTFNWGNSIEKAPEKWFSHAYSLKQLKFSWWLLLHKYLPGMEFLHLGQPMRKSTMQKVWEVFKNPLDETGYHRFRTQSDMCFYLFTLYEIQHNAFFPISRESYGKLFFDLQKDVDKIEDAILNGRYPSICINDSEYVDNELFEHLKTKLNTAFSRKFPEKSSFEK